MNDDIQRSLGRIEGMLKGILDAHKEMRQDIDSLLHSRSYAYGIVAAIGTAFGFIGSHLKTLIGLGS